MTKILLIFSLLFLSVWMHFSMPTASPSGAPVAVSGALALSHVAANLGDFTQAHCWMAKVRRYGARKIKVGHPHFRNWILSVAETKKDKLPWAGSLTLIRTPLLGPLSPPVPPPKA